jgi:molybdopterin synthase catalytic subunit
MSFLKETPLDVRTVAHQVVSPERGGVVTFIGAVRNHHAGRAVRQLEYSAYGPMADLEFARIVEEAESRWPATVAAEHRVGTLDVGDVAVIVVAAAAHRDAAFDACRYVIEELKRRVPIWKREHYVDGTAGWVDPTAPAGVILPVE